MDLNLFRLVGKNKYSEVIEKLMTHFESKANLDKLKEITLISSKSERFHEERKKGEKTQEQMELAENKIINSLMDLIGSLEDKDLKELKKNADELKNIALEEYPQIVSKKTKELAKWLGSERPKNAEKIAKKVSQIENIGEINKEKLTFDLVNALLIISDALERDNLENLDCPEEIFRFYLTEKKICLTALDLLFNKIPSRFDAKSLDQTKKIIEYFKERIINYLIDLIINDL